MEIKNQTKKTTKAKLLSYKIEELEEIEKISNLLGIKPTAFIRMVSVTRARKMLKQSGGELII